MESTDSLFFHLLFVVDKTWGLAYIINGAKMTTISVTEARNQMARLIDEITLSHQPVTIHNKKSKAILISEDDWRSMQETLYLGAVTK